MLRATYVQSPLTIPPHKFAISETIGHFYDPNLRFVAKFLKPLGWASFFKGLMILYPIELVLAFDRLTVLTT